MEEWLMCIVSSCEMNALEDGRVLCILGGCKMNALEDGRVLCEGHIILVQGSTWLSHSPGAVWGGLILWWMKSQEISSEKYDKYTVACFMEEYCRYGSKT